MRIVIIIFGRMATALAEIISSFSLHASMFIVVTFVTFYIEPRGNPFKRSFSSFSHLHDRRRHPSTLGSFHDNDLGLICRS